MSKDEIRALCLEVGHAVSSYIEPNVELIVDQILADAPAAQLAAPVAQERDYTRTFNAIGKAVTIEGKALGISVKAFWDAYDAALQGEHQPKIALTEEQVKAHKEAWEVLSTPLPPSVADVFDRF